MDFRRRAVPLSAAALAAAALAALLAPRAPSAPPSSGAVPAPLAAPAYASAVGRFASASGTLTVEPASGRPLSCRASAATRVSGDVSGGPAAGDVVHAPLGASGTVIPAYSLYRGTSLREYLASLPEPARNLSFNAVVSSLSGAVAEVRTLSGAVSRLDLRNARALSVRAFSGSSAAFLDAAAVRMDCVRPVGGADYIATALSIVVP